MTGLDEWLTDPRYRLIPPPEDPDNPMWCLPARKLIGYGSQLHAWAGKNPSFGVIAVAQGRLQTRYGKYYDHATDEHRLDKHHATHACLHRALLEISEKLEDLEMLIPVDDLLNVERTQPMGTVIEGEVVDEPDVSDVRDVIFGHERPEDGDKPGLDDNE